jgi:hypothetical protein
MAQAIEIVVDICGGVVQAVHTPDGYPIRVVARNFDRCDPEDRRTHIDADGSMYERTTFETGGCGWPVGDSQSVPSYDGDYVGAVD